MQSRQVASSSSIIKTKLKTFRASIRGVTLTEFTWTDECTWQRTTLQFKQLKGIWSHRHASKAASVKSLEILNTLHEQLLHYQHPTQHSIESTAASRISNIRIVHSLTENSPLISPTPIGWMSRHLAVLQLGHRLYLGQHTRFVIVLPPMLCMLLNKLPTWNTLKWATEVLPIKSIHPRWPNSIFFS